MNVQRVSRRLELRPLATAVAGLLASGALTATAHAQQENGLGPAETEIESIVVTASRRATTIQDLPFNIAAVSGATLEQQRVTNLTEVARWVPGLTVVDQGPRASNLMTVRGLNVRSLDASEFLDNSSGRTVATYLGEVPVYVDFKMKDLERIEVLLGPQGTLYGEGTLGGAVRYIPAAPDTQDFAFDLHGDLYSVGHSESMGYQADAVVNVPIVEGKLAFRGSFGYVDDPGFIDYSYLVRTPGVSEPQPDFSDPAAVAANLVREEDADWETTYSSRLALLWDVSEAVSATFNYYYQDQEVGGRTVNHRDAFNTGAYESAARFLEPSDRENSLLSAEISVDLGFADLVSATGWSAYEQWGQRDQTDLLLGFDSGYEDFPSFAAYTRETAEEDRFNEELRLVSKGPGKISWIGGLFYNDYELDDASSEFTPGWPDSVYYTGSATVPLATGDLEFRQVRNQTLTERAVFGEVSYEFTDRFAVTLGGRQFEYDFAQTSSIELPYFEYAATSTSATEDDGFLGKINASYDFSRNVMGYVTLSEGYRVGGANSVQECVYPLPPGQNACADPDEIQINPDTTTNFEIGVHSVWHDGDFIFNGAVYDIDWEDIQTLDVTDLGALPITVNGGEARSRGLELAFEANGLERWSFGASYAYIDAELTSVAPGLVGGEDGQPGDRLAGSPEHQGSFRASHYRRLANGWDLDVGYGMTFTSDVLTKVGMRDNGEVLGGYSVHQLSAGFAEDEWSAVLYIDNLTDKFAESAVRLDPSYIGDVDGVALRRYFRNVIRPRSVGIEFRYRFGA